MLSVVIPQGQEAELTEEWCREQLQGLDHEVIVAPSWDVGYRKTTGEFISFLENDCVLSSNYFRQLLEVFNGKPSYRKLAMITSATGANAWDVKTYGYVFSDKKVTPLKKQSSSDVYLVQVGYIPGAIIRRSALGGVAPKGNDVMMDSVNLSTHFWNHGQRVALHPGATYVSTDEDLDLPYPFEKKVSKTLLQTMEMWKRESIG